MLLGEPEVFGGACGGDVTAIACFQTLEAAEAGDSHNHLLYMIRYMMLNAYAFCSLEPKSTWQDHVANAFDLFLQHVGWWCSAKII